MITPDDLDSERKADQKRTDPTPYPLNTGRDEALMLLKGITKAMDTAMNSRNPIEFNRLCQQRKRLLENLAHSGTIREFSRDTLKSMEEESRRWLEQGKSMLEAIRSEIERLQAKKSKTRQVGSAYGFGQRNSPGRFFQNRG